MQFLGHVHAAVHMQRVAGNISGRRRSQKYDRCGDILDRTEPSGRDLFDERLALLLRHARVISVSINPGATALTVIPREPTSRASDLVKPIMPALAAA